jgi:hypothetical protein
MAIEPTSSNDFFIMFSMQVPNHLQQKKAIMGPISADILAHTADVLDAESILSLMKPAKRCLQNLAACKLAAHALVMQTVIVLLEKAFCILLLKAFTSRAVHFWSTSLPLWG